MFAAQRRPGGVPRQLRRRREARPQRAPPTPCSASAASACVTQGLHQQRTPAVGARLSSIDMNRDDKAHRFVVTWNAFLDGNRLAYLALDPGHRRRQPGVHVRPVRRQRAALAARFDAQPEAAAAPTSSRPSSRPAPPPDNTLNSGLFAWRGCVLHPRELVDGFTNEVRPRSSSIPRAPAQVR